MSVSCEYAIAAYVPCQWRRNYGDRGVHCTPKFRACTPCIRQVKDAAYVKILSKQLQLQDCIRFVQICTPTYENVQTCLPHTAAFFAYFVKVRVLHMCVRKTSSVDKTQQNWLSWQCPRAERKKTNFRLIIHSR